MAIKQKYQPPTNAEKLQRRVDELAYFARLKQEQQAQAEQQQAEHNAFVKRVEATRREQAKAKEQGLEWVPDTPILHVRDVWAQIRQEELQAKADAEAARIAALTPRELWYSTLNFQDQRKVEVWERVNRGQKYPMPGD